MEAYNNSNEATLVIIIPELYMPLYHWFEKKGSDASTETCQLLAEILYEKGEIDEIIVPLDPAEEIKQLKLEKANFLKELAFQKAQIAQLEAKLNENRNFTPTPAAPPAPVQKVKKRSFQDFSKF